MITVLFGAGATIPFVKAINSQDISVAIKNEANWDKVISNIPEEVKTSRCRIKRNALQIIHETKDELNFESIIEICDRVAGFYSDSDNDNLFNKVISFIQEPKQSRIKKESASFTLIPFLIREIIADYILSKEKCIPVSVSMKKIEQKDFINYLCSRDKRISLISLNYDTILFDSLLEDKEKGCLTNDITHDFTNNRSFGTILDVKQLLTSDRTIIFPHGSLLFNRLGTNDITFCLNSDDAETNRWKGLDNSYPSNTSIGRDGNNISPDFNSFIVSGQNKSLSLNSKPYDTFYYKMVSSIIESNVIIIIGFSFHDEHINNLIKNALSDKSETKLLIVDYQENFINNIELIKHFEKLCFFESIVEVVADKKESYQRDDKLCEIDEKKEGWLFKKRIYYYCKGYDSFLSNFESILKIIFDNPNKLLSCRCRPAKIQTGNIRGNRGKTKNQF